MNARAARLMAACALASAATGAAAQDAPAKRTELRVCQDPNNLPFSNTKGAVSYTHLTLPTNREV